MWFSSDHLEPLCLGVCMKFNQLEYRKILPTKGRTPHSVHRAWPNSARLSCVYTSVSVKWRVWNYPSKGRGSEKSRMWKGISRLHSGARLQTEGLELVLGWTERRANRAWSQPHGNTWWCLETLVVVTTGQVLWRLVRGREGCCCTSHSSQDRLRPCSSNVLSSPPTSIALTWRNPCI